ncbi:MAG: tripartite tricarboxylate transporter substrate binding protein [Actinobacteria bacterium]|nr:tripartite tricarboxylate transporter substrate binding protein [Actinomycetota bacterium]
MSSTRMAYLTSCVLVASLASACGLQTGGGGAEDGEAFQPDDTEFMVHTGPGGGSDIFARDIIAIMNKENLIPSNWPVRNEEAGEGAGAMSYLLEQKGESNIISGMTTTWLTTPQTIEGASVTVNDLTPVAGLIIEPEVMAVAPDSPYNSLTDFIEAAKEQPGELVQTGGSTTEVGALNGAALQAETGTEWQFLSFEEVGQRVTSLLNGDADMMFGAASDFSAQVEAGKLEIIASISPSPSPVFPDAPTTKDEGYDVALVPQVRGVMAPPEIPEEALTYYQDVFTKLVETDGWKEYAERNGVVTQLPIGEEWADFLAEQDALVKETLEASDFGG